jgi:hypothetical protein
MDVYRRVIGAAEEEVIRTTGIIPTNRDRCDPYSAGSVVFLFSDASLSAQGYEHAIRSLTESCFEESGSAWLLTLRAPIEVEDDKSGWGEPLRAVIHWGPAPLAGAEVTLEALPDPRPRPPEQPTGAWFRI